MKIKPHLIKKFEIFIQNSKDPNEKDQPKKNKQKQADEDEETQPDEDEETQDTSEDESDPIEELKKYFEARKNKLKK